MLLFFLEKINHKQRKQMKEIPQMGKVSSLYLKLLIPHEVEGLLDLGDCARAFPAEVCGCAPV